MAMQARPLDARAVRCGDQWIIEIPALSMRVPTYELDHAEDAVAAALSRRRGAGTVQVTIRSYLHLDDLPVGQRRACQAARSTALPSTGPDDRSGDAAREA
jgi:hypothetical protein